jgi:hypothetical protein
MNKKELILNKIKEKQKLLEYYKEDSGNIIIRLIDSLFFDNYSEKETYYQIRKLEEEIEKLKIDLLVIENNSDFENIYSKLLCLKNLGKINNDEFDTFIKALKNGNISAEKIKNMLISQYKDINCNEILKENNENYLKVITLLVKLSQKSTNLTFSNELIFRKIMETKFDVKDLKIIKKLFKMEIPEAFDYNDFIKKLYSLYPKEVEKAINKLSKFENDKELDKNKIKKLRLALTKYRMEK